MRSIEISPYDQTDLIEILEYAKINYEKEQKRGDRNDYEWYRLRISQLETIIKGKNVNSSIYGSSLNTMDGF